MYLRKLLLAMLVLLCPVMTKACDAWGCGIGGGGFGLLSLYRNNFVGLSYGGLPFRSKLSSGEYTGTEDVFHLLELQLRYEVLPGWRVDAFMPYRYNVRVSPDGDETLEGLGDLRFGVNYVLADNRPLGKQGGSWYWEAGLVVSTPTGAYRADLLDQRFLPDNFNLGRGALGYGLRSALVFNHQRVGLSLSGRHLRYAKSDTHYRFGAETSLAAQVFSQFSYDPHWKLIPFVGLNYERTAANQTVDASPVHATGGKALLAAAGLNVRYDDFTIGVVASLPLAQDYAEGMTELGLSRQVQILYNF